MASNPVVIHVRPNGNEWHVKVGESPLLMLRSKETAVAEAQVQAVLSRPSRIVLHGANGTVEEEATFPADAAPKGDTPPPTAQAS